MTKYKIKKAYKSKGRDKLQKTEEQELVPTQDILSWSNIIQAEKKTSGSLYTVDVLRVSKISNCIQVTCKQIYIGALIRLHNDTSTTDNRNSCSRLNKWKSSKHFYATSSEEKSNACEAN